jgi:hypothetical protein
VSLSVRESTTSALDLQRCVRKDWRTGSYDTIDVCRSVDAIDRCGQALNQAGSILVRSGNAENTSVGWLLLRLLA